MLAQSLEGAEGVGTGDPAYPFPSLSLTMVLTLLAPRPDLSPCPAQVFRDRHGMMGVVDYASKDDMKYALRKLDDSEFKVRSVVPCDAVNPPILHVASPNCVMLQPGFCQDAFSRHDTGSVARDNAPRHTCDGDSLPSSCMSETDHVMVAVCRTRSTGHASG